jgi:hypothetical protein
MKDYSNFYTNVTPNDKISHDGNLLLEHSLSGFEGYDVLINETINSRIMIYGTYGSDSESKSIIGRISDIERGNLLNVNGEDWLIVSYPEDNKVYRKAEIKLCNSTFPIQTDKTSVLMRDAEGNPITDRFGKPQYKVTETVVTTPCIVTSRYAFSDSNEQITLPEGKMELMLKSQKSDYLVNGFEFEMYGEKYKILNIDRTKVINDKGILTLSCERQV